MKKLITILSILFVSMIIHTQASSATFPPQQPTTSYEYKVKLGDVGEIQAKAPTKWGAYEVAAEECFNRRLALYESRRGQASEDRQLDLMDSCVNMN